MPQKILLIDDDDDDRFLFKGAVTKIDPSISCDTANDCMDGIKKLKVPADRPPGLIFVDLNMPVMDGFDCLIKIREVKKLDNIPVIIYSTSKNPADVKRAEELGAAAYFKKPDDYKQLCDTLKMLLAIDFSSLNTYLDIV